MKRALKNIIEEEGQTFLGFRDVPTFDEMLGTICACSKTFCPSGVYWKIAQIEG